MSDRVDVDNMTFSEIPEETRHQPAILVETEALPRNLVIVRPGIEPELLDVLTALLAGFTSFVQDLQHSLAG